MKVTEKYIERAEKLIYMFPALERGFEKHIKIEKILENIDAYIAENKLNRKNKYIKRLLFVATHDYDNRSLDIGEILTRIKNENLEITFDSIYKVMDNSDLDYWQFRKSVDFIKNHEEITEPIKNERIRYAIYLETEEYGNGFVAYNYPEQILVDTLRSAMKVESKHELDDSLVPYTKIQYYEMKTVFIDTCTLLDE